MDNDMKGEEKERWQQGRVIDGILTKKLIKKNKRN